MLDCPRCCSTLVLTSPACACGADVRASLDGVGLACGACEAWNPVGTAACETCGGELAATSTPTPTSTPTQIPIAAVTAPPPSGPPILQRTGRSRGTPIPLPAPAGGPALRLSVKRTNGTVASVPLGAAAVVCGRSDGDLVVPGETVSRHHARFSVRDGRAVVEDLGSLNGTWIRLRAPRALGFGDEIRLGSRRLRLAWTPAGAALEEIETGGASCAIHPLREGATTIGRAGDLRLDHLDLLHALLESSAGGHTISDLDSRTGTWFRLVAPEPVDAGDELLLGAERLRVEPSGG